MRKHVKPADPMATIADPDRGRDLGPEGHPVTWTPYWAGLVLRGDVIVVDEPEAADGDPARDAGAPAEPDPDTMPPDA